MQLFIKELKKHFKHHAKITKQDLYDFYRGVNTDFSEPILFWDLYELRRQKIIKPIYKDTFRLVTDDKVTFNPAINEILLTLNNHLGKFGLEDYCIWTSEWWNTFMTHQIIGNFILIEVENEATESIFYHLREITNKDVFLYLNKSDRRLLDRYVFEANEPIIIKKIITKSPVRKIQKEKNKISIPKLEKMLVDLFCDDELFIAYKGIEQQNIFGEVIENYEINFKTFFGYAKRRKKEKSLKEYLYRNFKNELIRILE